jgi:hypothetical protein
MLPKRNLIKIAFLNDALRIMYKDPNEVLLICSVVVSECIGLYGLATPGEGAAPHQLATSLP